MQQQERILFHEYGTQLRVAADDALILNVLCGRVGEFGVEFPLNEQEREEYRRCGETGSHTPHAAAPASCGITLQCSGPSRRASFLWFESLRGAGSATDRHYVILSDPVKPNLRDGDGTQSLVDEIPQRVCDKADAYYFHLRPSAFICGQLF